MRLPTSIALASVVVLVSAALHAQPPASPQLPDPLTLEQSLQIFRQRGFDLLLADAAVLGAEGDVKVAGAVPNPNFQLWGSWTSATNPPNSPWGVTAGLGDSNALEDSLSGKRWLRLKVARAALAAARMNRSDAQRTLELEVKTAYIQAVLARDSLDFALQVQGGANQIFQLNQTRYNAGAISEAELAKIETAKLQADQAVDVSTQALRAAKLQLAFFLGVRGSVPDFHVDQDLPRFVIPPSLANATAATLLDEAVQHRPDLRAAEHQRARAEAAIALARRDRFPDISLNLQYQQQAGFNASAAQPPTVSLGLMGTLPLFYFQRGEILRAEAELRAQQLQRGKLEAQLSSDVESAFNAFASTRKLVERMESRLLDRSRRARDLVSLQYQKGAASLLEYLDAQRTYIANNVDYLQELASYWTAVYQLEAAVGMDLR
ncbi:MAG: Heavy metal efflux outer membrane protein CzcC family [Myxococcales bacterium]|nr:Heavy metal efflux outer membrane protein CzcC family [Myxococcales bacterium]